MTADRHTSRLHDEVTELFDAAHETSTIVAIAWPTGRPIHPYTAAEIADGVDLYTRAMNARAAGTTRGDDDAPE
ncbi:hypothetical protein GKC29_14930 [Micromonospora sp. WMMC415]|uniref:hypothetical protein n=1 Tax=Micromonospora sp. WMMC415 TaxID=2675222 RepID=UPI0012B49F30|nr:hypothetical protein [Micromonospora sp. WMMC415]QGN48011.1 hypothetical protein GKC29_14930 [Micromonospora sp. WMMC415]